MRERSQTRSVWVLCRGTRHTRHLNQINTGKLPKQGEITGYWFSGQIKCAVSAMKKALGNGNPTKNIGLAKRQDLSSGANRW